MHPQQAEEHVQALQHLMEIGQEGLSGYLSVEHHGKGSSWTKFRGSTLERISKMDF